MKKLYSLFVMLMVSMLSISIQAKTVKFICNLPNAVMLTTPKGTWGTLPTDSPQAVLWDVEEQMHLAPQSGYEIAKITKNETVLSDSKIKNYNMEYGDFEDGDLITVEATEIAVKKYTFIGDASHVYIYDQYNYRTYRASDQDENGAWVISVPSITYFGINAYDGYGISSVDVDVDGDSDPLYPDSPSYITIYSGTYSTSQTFIIHTFSYAEARDKSATVEIVGDKSSVSAYRKGNVRINTSEFDDFKFFQDELPLTFSHTTYGKSLYKVTVNGVEADRDGNDWKVTTLEDGAVIRIEVDYPEVDVPFTANFINEGTESIITTFNVNNQSKLSEFTEDGFTVPLGAQIYLRFDKDSYDISSIKINDTSLDLSGSSVYWSGTVTDETGFTIEVEATAYDPFHVKIFCREFSHLKVTKSDYTELELTEAETTVELPRSFKRLTFAAEKGWLMEVMCGERTLDKYVDLSTLEPVDGYIEINVYLEEYVRDKQLVVFLQDGTWNYHNLTLSNSNYDMREVITLENGYNFIMYNENDLPLALNLYGADYSYSTFVYLNGEIIENKYGAYPATDKGQLEEGSVIKIFQKDEPETHTVNLSIADDAKALVHADYVTAKEAGGFGVHHGTHIVISAAAAAQAPEKHNAAPRVSAPFEVTVDGEPVNANENGKVVVPVLKDTEIAVKAPVMTSVDEVIGDNDGPKTVYNLQGIKVMDNAEQLNSLPAGLYIVDGKKVLVK